MFKSAPDVGRTGRQHEAWWELSLHSREANRARSEHQGLGMWETHYLWLPGKVSWLGLHSLGLG